MQLISERDYELMLKSENSKKTSFFGSFISSASTSQSDEIDDFLKKSPTKK